MSAAPSTQNTGLEASRACDEEYRYLHQSRCLVRTFTIVRYEDLPCRLKAATELIWHNRMRNGIYEIYPKLSTIMNVPEILDDDVRGDSYRGDWRIETTYSGPYPTLIPHDTVCYDYEGETFRFGLSPNNGHIEFHEQLLRLNSDSFEVNVEGGQQHMCDRCRCEIF